MARFDRYMLSQLFTLFGFFSLVLVLIYWINRAVRLFDQLIADGQTAIVFLEFTAMTLPQIIRIVLPLAAFVAATYVTNRMSSDSELTVVQATGFSAFRLARPVLVFGLTVTGMMLVLTHFLAPMSTARLADRSAEISRNMTARLLTEGTFTNPADGITFYIREITPTGELLDVFLSDNRDPDQAITYTTNRAYLVRTENGPQLVMIDGMAQTLDTESQRLFTTTFTDFAFDIGALVPAAGVRNRSWHELSTQELLNPTPELEAETGRSAGALIVAGHDRFDQAFLATVAALIGFATLMTGGFSRFGVWRQIIAAVFLVIVVKGLESTGAGIARANPALWPMVYLPTVGGAVIVWTLLFAATRPYLFKRRMRGVPA
ncbi:LPS export ABC transporter permease LptF [Octadecabacter sp. R77987]|uniref:LPS export ABC transporter permease LptF n=1 Tax=Octadecabacter sp. R77987 TaxID=3093874 RepID=UPI00366E38F9